MRVIAGSARRIMLATPQGMDTRPTTDRTKETLFNIINYDLPDCRFLDLFSGSGAIGIEALSRGAEYAVFVEQERQALECIAVNLKKTALAERCRVLAMEVMGALQLLDNSGEPFDLIFMDPPYRKGLEEKVLERLSRSDICTKDTMVIVEASLDTEFEYAKRMGFEVTREKKYKTNKHVFLRRLAVQEEN